MHLVSRSRLLVLALYSSLALASVFARSHGQDDNGGGDADDDGASTTPVTTSTSVAGTAGKGDTKCMTLLCASAIVNTNNTVTYVLQSTGQQPLGWMAIGFGTQMPNTPMVIMWPNADGSITLSQRQASAHVQPTVVASPPRVASKVPSLTAATATNPKLAFNVPANSDTQQDLIWAFASSKPSGPAVDAQIQQHLQSGTFQLNLAGNSASFDPASTSGGAGGGSNGGSGSISIPLEPYQKLIAAHAVLCSLGFLVLLPAGALIARYLRVVSPNWFRPHAYTQFWVSGPVIFTGFILAIVGVQQAEAGHFNDRHKVLGLIIVLCYCVQCSLGAFIHWVKDPNRKRRPPQNYLHAVFGLAIIGLSFYQVHLGYDVEWPATTGRDDVPDGINKVWIAWTILITLAYFGGLVLLKKQFTQERAARASKVADSSQSGTEQYQYRALSRD